MFFIQETERWPGPDLRIDCPACGARGADASSFDQRIKDSYLGIIPLKVTRSTWVVCSECRAQLSSRVGAAELGGKTADELADLVVLKADFVRASVAVIALLIAIIPLVGLVMAIIASAANRKSPGWPKYLSYLALAISLVEAVLFVILLVSELV
jgi:hypothetical protein